MIDSLGKIYYYSNPKSFVNFLLPDQGIGEGRGGVKFLRLLQELLYNFNKNLLVDDTKKVEKYTHIEKVQYKESELKSRKLNFLIS